MLDSFVPVLTVLTPSVSAKASILVFSWPEDCGEVSVSIFKSGRSVLCFRSAYSKL